MAIIDSLLSELEEEATLTRRVLERVPDDKLNWKPHPTARPVGALAMHIATNPAGVAAAASVDVFELPNAPQPEAKSRAELLEALDRSLKEARQKLSQMDDRRLAEPWKLSIGGKVVWQVPRVAFLRAILLNHWYHHRGQLQLCLRMMGVPVPAVYGASADENPFAQAVGH